MSVTAELLLGFWVFVCQVESYVAHIRGLLEERECLTAEYERDNEHLRHELHQIRQQQGEFNATVDHCWYSFHWVVAKPGLPELPSRIFQTLLS